MGQRCPLPRTSCSPTPRPGAPSATPWRTAVARLAEDAPVRLRWTGDPDEFRDAVTDAGDGTRIVVAGGDGSIHLASQTVDSLGRTDEPIGIVPLGTGNDFARNHDLPLDPTEAAETIIMGSSEPGGGHRTALRRRLHPAGGQQHARRPRRRRRPNGQATQAARWDASPTPSEPPSKAYAAPARSSPSSSTANMCGTGRCWRYWSSSVRAWAAATSWPRPPTAASMSSSSAQPNQRERISLVRSAIRSQLPDDEHVQRWTGRNRSRSRGRGGVDANVDGELRPPRAVRWSSPTAPMRGA